MQKAGTAMFQVPEVVISSRPMLRKFHRGKRPVQLAEDDVRSRLFGRRRFGVDRREYKHEAPASGSGRNALTRLRFVLVLPAKVAPSNLLYRKNKKEVLPQHDADRARPSSVLSPTRRPDLTDGRDVVPTYKMRA
jgi:hypothetical protein